MTFEQRLDHDGADLDALIEEQHEDGGDERHAAPEARKDQAIPLSGFDISSARAPSKDTAAAWRRRLGEAPRPTVRFAAGAPHWNFAEEPQEEASAVPAAPTRKRRGRRAAAPDSDADIDATRAYFNEIGRRPLLTADQEQELGAAIERAAGSTRSSTASKNSLASRPGRCRCGPNCSGSCRNCAASSRSPLAVSTCTRCRSIN